jgi:hypothetical protein
MMTMSSPPQLDYGLAPARRQKRAIRAVVIFAAVLVAYAAWQWGPVVWQQLPILYWQRQCLRYTASADSVVYEEDPAEATRLISTAGYVRYKLTRGGTPDTTPATTFAAAAPFPRCWRRFTQLVPPKNPLPGSGSGAILFLHERISPRGKHRLVCVRYFAETYSFTTQFIEGYNADYSVITPATWSSSAAIAAHAMSIDVISGFPRHPPRVRIYAGQAEPDDSSRFTIRYEMWGKSDVLDGVLDDADQVKLTPRKPPHDD